MRSHHSSLTAGLAAATLALTLAGCGEDPGIESGSVPFKKTDTSSLAPLREDMIRNIKNQADQKTDGKSDGTATGSRGAADPGAEANPASGSGPAPSTGPGAKGG